MADKRVRAATRATITRTTNTAKEILATEASEDSSVQLQGLANLLRSKLNLIDELDRKILAEWDDDNNELLAKEIEDSGNYQQTIYSTLAEIESFLHASTTVKDDVCFLVHQEFLCGTTTTPTQRMQFDPVVFVRNDTSNNPRSTCKRLTETQWTIKRLWIRSLALFTTTKN